MTKVIADISMSLDGFVTGPDPDLEHGLGQGGEPLHTWAVESDDPVDAGCCGRPPSDSGAVVMGRRLFDIIDGPHGWNDEMGYGAGLVGTPPFFVVTHSAPDPVRLELDFTFVTDGLAPAIDAALGQRRAIEGRGRDGRRRRDPPVRRRRPGRRAAPPPRADRARRGHAAVRRRRPARVRAAIESGCPRRRPT